MEHLGTSAARGMSPSVVGTANRIGDAVCMNRPCYMTKDTMSKDRFVDFLLTRRLLFWVNVGTK